MIDAAAYADFLMERFPFWAGVPDSLLKPLCACLGGKLPGSRHIVADNEGGAVALAAGHYLATGRPAAVYMQNSGIGNAVNPLLSLCDPLVFSLPFLMLIGWRGEPGIRDEPQHLKQGIVTLPLLETMGIKCETHPDSDEAARVMVEKAFHYMEEKKAPFALVVKKNTFSNGHVFDAAAEDSSLMSREEAIEAVLDMLNEDDVYVSTTGMASRELFELRDRKGQTHAGDFLCVGSMGHASRIAAAIALEKRKTRVVCLDGDGAVLMHMGALAIIGAMKLPNFVHIVLNNGAHDSVGGQSTVAHDVDLCAVAAACGYKKTFRIEDKRAVDITPACGPVFIEIIVRRGNRTDLGRPSLSPRDNKELFMERLSNLCWLKDVELGG
ncbi:MAG: phosphonopyruvate decarboxylase [Synergistaceae bacterium]|jgi:phosphonopyruvate decarboxylase|nr:phosphonopyruvate decarboxylase [Synergistaceae bacterium]